MKKKKGQVLYITGRDDQIATSIKLLDITNESGFNADLIETINLAIIMYIYVV